MGLIDKRSNNHHEPTSDITLPHIHTHFPELDFQYTSPGTPFNTVYSSSNYFNMPTNDYIPALPQSYGVINSPMTNGQELPPLHNIPVHNKGSSRAVIYRHHQRHLNYPSHADDIHHSMPYSIDRRPFACNRCFEHILRPSSITIKNCHKLPIHQESNDPNHIYSIPLHAIRNSSTIPDQLAPQIQYIQINQCSHCGTTHTAQWRYGPNGKKVCNACGLRYRKAIRNGDRHYDNRLMVGKPHTDGKICKWK